MSGRFARTRMNSEEAKNYLQASRLGGQDLEDPRMAEAFEQARRDPELAAWYEEQKALDEVVCAKIREAPVPPHLLGELLAQKKQIHPSRPRRSAFPWALAAAIVVLLSIGALVERQTTPSRPAALASLRTDMARFLAVFPRLDLEAEQWPDIMAWLARKPRLENADIPAGLQRFPGIGCREVRWRGHSLMLICLAADGEVVHLFVFPKKALPGLPDSVNLVFRNTGEWSTAFWSQGNVAYLALTRAREGFLKNLLADAN